MSNGPFLQASLQYPNKALSQSNGADVQFTTDTSTSYPYQSSGIARLALHVPEERLPAAIGMANCVPQSTIRDNDSTDVQFPIDACTTDRREGTGIARLALHVPEERLPAAIGMADRVPHPPTFSDPAD